MYSLSLLTKEKIEIAVNEGYSWISASNVSTTLEGCTELLGRPQEELFLLLRTTAMIEAPPELAHSHGIGQLHSNFCWA